MTELSENSKLPSPYQEFIYKRSYSRWIEAEKRREDWGETVERYKNFFLKRIPEEKKGEFSKICNSILNLEIMPSMRTLWSAGKALEVDNIAAYNCAYLPIDSTKSFAEMMYILLCGTGVGFSVESQYVNELPTIPQNLKEEEQSIVFADSKLGWAKGFYIFLKGLYSGKIYKCDFSKIRPAGARLKTFGGKASGPQPIQQLLEYIKRIFISKKGNKLSTLDCHDICCYIANVVVSGGVRRSASISLSDLYDDRLRDAKSGEFWMQFPYRSLANNSAVYEEKPSITSFLKEWVSLIQSRSGERGIFNRHSTKFLVAQIGRRDYNYAFGPNPCCFTGDMSLLTDKGYLTFKELNGENINLVDKGGSVSSGKVWLVGEKDIVKISIEKGNKGEQIEFKCTPDHVFLLTDGTECAAKNLKGKRLMPYSTPYFPKNREAFIAGFIQGDGNTTRLNSKNHLGLEINIGNKDGDVWKYINRVIDDAALSSRKVYSRKAYQIAKDYKLSDKVLPERVLPTQLPVGEDLKDFLCGLFSANGTTFYKQYEYGKICRVSLRTTCKKLVDDLQLILKNQYNIDSSIIPSKSRTIKFKNGSYETKDNYSLAIVDISSIKIFVENINFIQQYKRDILNQILQNCGNYVKSVVYSGKDVVYDFNEPNTNYGVVNGFIVHNSEIILRPMEFCNLSEVVVRSEDTKATILKKVREATVLGCVQATLTDFNFINRAWKKNCEEERLLGVSLTGLCDHPILKSVSKKAKLLLSEMKQTAIDTAEEWSHILEINMPAAITCVKPSGTVSQLVDSSSGLHPRFSPYYIRRIRVDKMDAICQFLKEKGVPYNPEVGCTEENTNVFVFDFPIKSPETSLINDDVGAIKQLDYWLMLQKYWCEHKPSVTIYVGDDEWLEVANWVYKNWDFVSGISFLPKDNSVYQLSPYEEIDEDTYEELMEKFPGNIDFSELINYEKDDTTEGAKEYACSAGGCEI